jgi:glutamine cyclotransferase
MIALLLVFLPVGCRATGRNQEKAERYKAKMVKSFPHDTKAYTQGLFFHEGRLYESSGQYGSSFFRETELKKSSTLRSINLDKNLFAEGSVIFKERIYILTWRENLVLVYDPKTFKHIGNMRNPREGWGLTTDGKYLISSDGSSNIYFHDPETFLEKSRLTVTLNGKELPYLNELEYIDGEIWANVYDSEHIVIIDPSDGEVRATVDCSELLPVYQRNQFTDVLNGIAYDAATGNIYVTGKYWPKLFQIELERL